MCPSCRAFITTDDTVCPYCDVKLGPRAIDVRSPPDVLGGLIPHARFTTVMILLLNTGLYVAMILRSAKTGGGGGLDMDFNTLYDFGAKVGTPIRLGQWWRLITAGFLHGGLFHILMNSWVLFDLGTRVEESYGTSRYIVFYFVTTVTGFLASFYWTPTLSIGSSAGIFGLIGAMIVYGLHDRSALGSHVRSLYTRWALYGLLFGLLPFFAIDNAAHLGGLAGGLGIAYLAGTPRFSEGAERFWQIVAGVCLAVTAWAFAQVFIRLLSASGGV
jgi:rhomboid protease GluP